ncbi:MAG: STAS domain-containing protein [Prevotella sp.]|nr:STAS domain-containing protein [Prevotella sp.]
MDIRFSEEGSRLIVAFIGDLDNTTAIEAERKLQRVFQQDEYDVVVECSHLNYISSKGLRLLILLYKHLRDSGHIGYITKMNSTVRDVLYTGGFLELYKEIVEE